MAKPTSLEEYRSRNPKGQTVVSLWEEDGKILIRVGGSITAELTESRVEVIAGFLESYLEARRSGRKVVTLGGER